jgi:hypothetical protein
LLERPSRLVLVLVLAFGLIAWSALIALGPIAALAFRH